MTRVLGSLVFVLASVGVSWAQANPYQSPAPGWVFVQPCGEDPGWVPPNHPLATIPPCYLTQAQPEVPDPARPWTLHPQAPMELGHAYRDPYGLVLLVTRIEQKLVYGEDGQKTVVFSCDGLLYQSVDLYHHNVGGRPSVCQADEPRLMWWEVQ